MDVAQLAWLTEQEIAEPLPLETVPDWQEQLAAGERLARLIDRHLDHEEELRREHCGTLILDPDPWLTPSCLCRAQKVAVISDAFAVAVEGR